VQYGRHLAIHLPGVTDVRCRVSIQREDQDLAFPNRLRLKFLNYMDAHSQAGLRAVGQEDGALEARDGQLVQFSRANSICSLHLGYTLVSIRLNWTHSLSGVAFISATTPIRWSRSALRHRGHLAPVEMD